MNRQDYIKNWIKNNPNRVKEYRKRADIKRRKKHLEYIKKYDKTHKEEKWQKEKLRRTNPQIRIKYNKAVSDYYRRNPDKANIIGKIIIWSEDVKKRDDAKCQICNTVEDVKSHHIFYKSLYPQLQFLLNNGITLCHKHHMEVHGWNYSD